MSMTIGRASFSTNAYQILHDGDMLTFSIDIDPGTVNGAKALRQQLSGLRAGEAVPVTWSEDSDFDGFYLVSGSPQVSPAEVYLSTGFMRCAISLQRVRGGYAGALVELNHKGWDLSSDVSTTSNNPLIPTQITTTGDTPDDQSERVTATGSVWITGGTSQRVVAQIEPDEFYNGACLIEYEQGGTWYPLVGHQVPDGVPVRIGNGLIRGSWDSANDEHFDLEVYEGDTDSAWQGVDYIYSSNASGNGTVQRLRPLVLRNDPEVVTVRWPFATKNISNQFDYTTIDFSVQRGEYHFTISGVGRNISFDTGTAHDTTEVQVASTDVGYRANAANADGHVWLLVSFDATLASGNMNISPNETIFFGVHPDTGVITESNVLDSMRYVTSQRQRVIT